ncbi:TonB family protein [Pontibacter ummariensis]|uniref:TonB family C-terminal domain-containing protein n=1 Tax=Pontibacter ummariensis TaxID=1610492 RepID=A0A239KI24_9BACT|nr:M56 family metallopeptidase [Pontibacter ummariensis]PRY05738.1 TonB family protein [Pontibacter ummariensis]SNT17650.1 TonB family C-terminal domain-containing protein [Pontibacter ummariensis]
MEATLNIILKSGLGLLALYLFYYLLLRNETNFRFNRLYLLLAPPVALALPLVKWPSLLHPATSIAQTLQTIQLTEVRVVPYRAPDASSGVLQFLTLTNIAVGFYLLVALFLLFKLLRQLWHIRELRSKATSIEQTTDDVQVVQLPQHYSSFAFLNKVFLSKQEQLNAREKQQVLAHELAHVTLGHTYDVLFYELLSILLWFNPLIWLLKKELRNLHEFQADARVLEQHQPQEYGSLLSKEVLFNMGLPVGSHFQKPQVLQRLYMLKQHGKQPNWLKPLLTLPLLMLLLFSLTSQKATADVAAQLATPGQGKALPEATQVQEDGQELPSQQKGAPAPSATEEAVPAPEQHKTTPGPGEAPPVDAPAQEKKPDGLVHDLLDRKADQPYAYVEQMPRFRGGEQEMLKFLAKNIRYPKEAQEAGLEGLVVVSFDVDDDGSLGNIQIIKSLGMGTDEEAMHVVEQMNGNWEPGTQGGRPVPVRYTLPIRFAIK